MLASAPQIFPPGVTTAVEKENIWQSICHGSNKSRHVLNPTPMSTLPLKKRWRAVLNFSKDFPSLGTTLRGGFQLEAQAVSSRGAHLKRTIIILGPHILHFPIVKRGCRADSICSFRTNPQVLALPWLFQPEVKGHSNNWTWPFAHPPRRVWIIKIE